MIDAKNILTTIPSVPGVYQYFNKNGKIIYIGKAKDLKRRVSSYFNRIQDNLKTTILVRQIHDIKYIVVENEQDALLLENSLIKKYKPRYNVLLKDDKSYPWICVKNEPFPRIFYTRNLIRDGSQYFGPFTSMFLVNTLIDFIRDTYKIRTCSLNLSSENVSRGKFKVCLQYHLGNCLGPCEKKQTEKDYLMGIKEIETILKGNIGQVISKIKLQMKVESGNLHFELAQALKEKHEILSRYQSKSIVVNPNIKNIDVYSFIREEEYVFINYLKIVHGCIINSFTLELKEKIDEDNEDLLLLGITEIRSKIPSNATEILVPFKPSINMLNVRLTVPKQGEKKKLLDLSEKNARYFIFDKRKNEMNRGVKFEQGDRENSILLKAKDELHLTALPIHIECFDNSNLQGTNAVAACVVFRNGKPAKSDYRHFLIKTVEGPNDFASMKEVVSRRYKRLLEEKGNLPQLIIIDGGKGQLSAAVEGLEELGLRGKVAVIGIAKRLEELYYPNDPVPLYLSKNSDTLKLIQRLRDEAHRFGISHHRSKRSKQMVVSELDQIKGIGSNSKELLFNQFKSIESIKKTNLEELIAVLGKNKGLLVFNHFNTVRLKKEKLLV
jgi:excinuclease ABC subunit C